jgi:hypothetical protein
MFPTFDEKTDGLVRRVKTSLILQTTVESLYSILSRELEKVYYTERFYKIERRGKTPCFDFRLKNFSSNFLLAFYTQITSFFNDSFTKLFQKKGYYNESFTIKNGIFM